MWKQLQHNFQNMLQNTSLLTVSVVKFEFDVFRWKSFWKLNIQVCNLHHPIRSNKVNRNMRVELCQGLSDTIANINSTFSGKNLYSGSRPLTCTCRTAQQNLQGLHELQRWRHSPSRSDPLTLPNWGNVIRNLYDSREVHGTSNRTYDLPLQWQFSQHTLSARNWHFLHCTLVNNK